MIYLTGGHSYEDLSSMDNSLIIDVSNMNTVSVLSGQDRAVVQSGQYCPQYFIHLMTYVFF
jgi:hypothetical protein